MKTALVCVSIHHGNTRRVAQAMAEVLGAGVFAVEVAAALDGHGYDLIGFGSGIYFGRHHASLRNLIGEMPSLPQRAFVFSTAGVASLAPIWHKSLIRRLRRRGCQVIGQFCCPGWDTVGPLRLFGGLHAKRPNKEDLRRAADFVQTLVLKAGPMAAIEQKQDIFASSGTRSV